MEAVQRSVSSQQRGYMMADSDSDDERVNHLGHADNGMQPLPPDEDDEQRPQLDHSSSLLASPLRLLPSSPPSASRGGLVALPPLSRVRNSFFAGEEDQQPGLCLHSPQNRTRFIPSDSNSGPTSPSIRGSPSASPQHMAEQLFISNALREAIVRTQLTAYAPAALQFPTRRGALQGIPSAAINGDASSTCPPAPTIPPSLAVDSSKRTPYRKSAASPLIPEAFEVQYELELQKGTFVQRLKRSLTTLLRRFRPLLTNKVDVNSEGNDATPGGVYPVIDRVGDSLSTFTKSTSDLFQNTVVMYQGAPRSCLQLPIVHPANSHRMNWNSALAAVLVWILVEVPVQVCYNIDVESGSSYDKFGLCIDIFFLLDVVVNFHTGFLDDGRYVDNPMTVAKNYALHGFSLDFLTSVPYSRIITIVEAAMSSANPDEAESADSNSTADPPNRYLTGETVGGTNETEGVGHDSRQQGNSLAVLPRLLRIFRIVKLVKLFRCVKLLNVIKKWEDEASVAVSRGIRIFKLFFQMVFMAHCASCLFSFIAMNAKTANDGEWDDRSWVTRYSHNTGDLEILTSKSRMYLCALYWALTCLTTVGFGDILPFTNEEILLTICVMVSGTMVFSYIMASIQSVVQSEDMTAIIIKKKIGELNEYMKHRQLPLDLQKRIKRHYEFQWKRSTIFDEESILASLPPFLRMDVVCSMNLQLLQVVPMLKALGDDCMAHLVTKLKPLALVPGEMAVKKGQVGQEMYFVCEGILDVYVCDISEIQSTLPVTTMLQGSYFGEPAILSTSAKPIRRSASLVARTFCCLECLTRSDFLSIKVAFPAVRKLLKTVAVMRGSDKSGESSDDDDEAGVADTRRIRKDMVALLSAITSLELNVKQCTADIRKINSVKVGSVDC